MTNLGSYRILRLWYMAQILFLSQHSYTRGQPPNTELSGIISTFSIGNDQPLRDTVYQVEDYACGEANFCNSTIAKYSGQASCLDCKPCSCEASCLYFGDCCPDILFRDSDRRSTPISPYVSCERRYPTKREFTGQPYLFMVTKCPDDYVADDSVRTKCEKAVTSDFEQVIPVSNVQSQLTYINKFCARCHGVTIYQPWGIQFECRDTDSLNSAKDKSALWKMVLDNPTCLIRNFPPKGLSIKSCSVTTINRCNVSGLWEAKNEYIETLCEMYGHPVELNRNLHYKNVFCALCNGERFDRNESCFLLPDDSSVKAASYPLSVLIDFNPRSDLTNEVELSPEAGTKCDIAIETYNPFLDQCAKLKCPPRRIMLDGTCKMFYASTKGLGYAFSMYVKFSEGLERSDFPNVSDQYQERLRQEFAVFRPFEFSLFVIKSFLKVAEQKEGQGSLIFTDDITGMKVSVEMVSASTHTVLKMEESIKAVQSLSFLMGLGVKNVTLTSIPIVCPDSLDRLPEREAGPSSNYTGSSKDLGCPSDCLADVIYEPVQDALDCPYLVFNLTTSNFKFDLDNSSLIFNKQTIYLNSSDYVNCGEILKLCSTVLQAIHIEITDFVSNRTIPEEGASTALVVVSIVCIALSLLCLLITFVIFWIRPQLRTLPIKNTMALIVHLFCAQLLFQVGIRMTYTVTLCKVISVLIHYLWMSAFAWMGMCAYHMYAVFRQMTANRFHSRTNETKNVIRSILVCNGSAAIIVIACIVYHLGASKGEQIGYGGRICFLNEPFDIGVFFAAPLGVVLIFNTFCFIRTTMALRSVSDLKSDKNKANSNHMRVYFRLSAILGFTWIFGFIAAAIQTEALWYVFVILNGLQGVFIFIAYCANRSTWDLLTKRFGRKLSVKYKSGDRSRSSETNTASTIL